jgi:hypothetical protein
VCTAAGFLSLWKLRNELCFPGVGWTCMDKLLRQCARMMREWRVLNIPEDAAKLETWASQLERRSFLPPRLDWCQRPPRQDYAHHPDSGVGGECSELIVDDVVQMRRGENVITPGFDPGGEADGVRTEHAGSVRQVDCLLNAGMIHVLVLKPFALNKAGQAFFKKK